MIRLRPALDSIDPYVPGRAHIGAAAEAAEVARLASNELPWRPPQAVVVAIAAAAASLNRYPDDDAVELVETLAEWLQVGPDAVMVGNGSSELLQRCALATLDADADVVFAWPSFAMYRILAEMTGAHARTVPLSKGGFHDLEAMAAAIGKRTRLVFVCTPNNPTGTAVGRDELGDFLAAVPDDVLVVLDEAYHEFVDTERDQRVHADGVPLVEAHPNVVVTRTFSKAFGLAGLRCGYGVGHPDTVAAIGKVRMPFVSNSLAQQAALAAIRSRDVTQERIAALIVERRRVATALASLGIAVPPSHGNFVWLDVPGRASELTSACDAAGVLVRPLGPDGVRVTVGTPAQNDRFVAVCEALFCKSEWVPTGSTK